MAKIRGKCRLCDEEDDDILNHLRLMHPDVYEEKEKPNGEGGVAIEDEEDKK